MASKPDNWLFYRNKLANDIGYHVETLDKYMKELISSGWVVKSKQAISEDGKFGSVSYYLMDVPVTENFHNEPMGKITVTENYRDGKFPKHNNKDILNNKNNINNKECEYSACARNDQMWMESLAMRSKTGLLIFNEWENISSEFIAHIIGVDELSTIQSEKDFKRRFYYWFLKERKEKVAPKRKENGLDQAKGRLAERVRQASND
ncbi:MAG: hypothetical protein ACRDDZ_01415 [Marinifilaceae bacterium]